MFSFSTENVQSKNMYKIFTRKEKNEKVSYIMNKGVVLYSGNSLQTMHSLVGGGGGNNGDCTSD